ncbi:unnamed protein product [Oncorhynchus mykiss]|uniref:UTP25 NTP hydrolase-like domain-containing protein n=1 Tax=Oncorhynchus mykiss TaxID=8022 RepID=A0A060VT06_ONCMY|nr:unnamed protein product [Oncorhynchus mykiss]
MQNWEHLPYVMTHLNLQPLDPHGVDFYSVHIWNYCQTLLFSSIQALQLPWPCQCVLSLRAPQSTVCTISTNELQWGKKVFSQPPIVLFLPLKKMRPVIFIIGTLQLWQTK